MKRESRMAVALCAMALASVWVFSPGMQAQSAEKAPLYTYVAEWDVPRAMWADYEKVAASSTDAMRKAVEDGTIVSYGRFEVLNHQEGNPTHGSWFSATSMANLMKVLEGLRNAPNLTNPVFAASKHWDLILSSKDYNAHSGTFANGYLRVGSWRPKAGSSDPEGKVLRATIGAMLEKLLADGALHTYQLDTETIHSQDPGTMFVAIVTNGAEGLDKFNAALDEAQKNHPDILAAYGSLIDGGGHRDTLARVPSMTHK